MGSRTTDHSPFCGEGRCRSQEEENRGMKIEEVFPLCFFPMLSVCLREVFGRRAWRGVSEGYTESAKNLERGVRIHPHPHSTFRSRRQGSMEVSGIEVLLACLGSQHFYSTKCEMLANLTAKNSDYRPYNAFKTTFKTSLIWLVHGGEAHDSWWGISGTLVFRSTVQEQVEVSEEPKDVKGEFGWSVCEETGWKYGWRSVNRVVQDKERER